MSEYRTLVEAGDFHPATREFFRGRPVAVTGGAGFIGSHVVEQLLLLGAEVRVLTRLKEAPFLCHLRGSLDVQVCDLGDYGAALRGIEGASAVLHLAATVAGLEYNASHPASIFQDNLTTFFNTIRAAQTAGVDRFLVTSSACVYPRHCSIPTPESEGVVGEPEPTNSGYGWAKRMQEYLGKQYQKEFGFSVAIARPYNAYGPRDNFDQATSHVIPALIRKAFLSTDGALRVWGDGSHSRSFVYVDDFSRGLLEVAARYPEADPLNIGSEEEVSIRAIAEIIASLVSEVRGHEIRPLFDPAGLTGQPRRMCDTSKAKSLLGFVARVPLKPGLRRTVEWFATHENRTLPTHP